MLDKIRNFLMTKCTTNRFSWRMLREQRKLARHLKSLTKKLGYNNEDLYGGCVIVSCWIISRAIDDQEYIDNFFEFYLKVNFLPDNKEAPVHLSEAFQYCEPYFKQWTKNPATGHRLAEAILHVITGDGSEKKYGDTECMLVFEFFAERFKTLLETSHSLRKRIK